MADYEKYSAAIWQILIEVMEKDLATIGKYGVGYDQKMKNRIEGTANLVLAFRHYGLINASSKSGQRVKQLYDKSNK
ncbi:MAG: hypothetical protein KDC83_14745 [Flavobacteriales bacterium]|nr:hypothetical protein [Flavobacteriales bacterium]